MKKRIWSALTVLLSVIFVLSGTMGVYAATTENAKERAELREDCTLTVTYSLSGIGLAEQNIKLYHIADITADAEYTLAGSFRDYPVTVTGTSSQTEWDEMTTTLNSYVLADRILPDREGQTDSSGRVKFSELTAGMYLVGSLRLDSNGKLLVFESFMAAVPGVNENGSWVYDVKANPKASENIPSKGKVTYSAVKIWKDTGDKTFRPDSVTVEILKNGSLQITVKLCSENDWSYSWDTVDDGSVWSVTERNVPQGYTVNIQGNGDVFQVTNVRHSSEEAPKTGDTNNIMLYFIFMAVSGIVLVILGIALRKDNCKRQL